MQADLSERKRTATHDVPIWLGTPAHSWEAARPVDRRSMAGAFWGG
jgi:hypothetical protein